MISDENLRQLREMITEIMETTLQAYGLKRPPSAAALRQQRYRERKAANVTGHNETVTPRPAKRNAPSRNRHAGVTGLGAVNGEAVAFIPIVGGQEYGVSKALLAELEKAYPDVDGPATLLEVRAWCVTNPGKRKTANGVPRFLNGWFERLQNRG